MALASSLSLETVYCQPDEQDSAEASVSCTVDADCPGEEICEGSLCVSPNGVKIPETTKIIDESSDLQYVSPEKEVVCFAPSSSYAQNINEGDVIVAGVAEKTPQGLLRKVVSVGGGDPSLLCVKTIQSSLEEAIEQAFIKGHIEFSQDYLNHTTRPISEEGAVTQEFPLTAGLSQSGTLDINFVNEDLYRGLVLLNGGLTITAGMDFEVDIRRFTIDNALVKVSGEESLDLRVTAGYSQEFRQELPAIEPVAFPPFTFLLPTAPPFPVVVIPRFTITLGTEAKGELQIETGVWQSSSGEYGFRYNNGRWQPFQDTDYQIDFVTPQLSLGGSLEAYARSQFLLDFYGVGGPQFTSKGYTKAEGTLSPEQEVTLSAGLEARGGLEARVWGHTLARYEGRLYLYEEVLSSTKCIDNDNDKTYTSSTCGTIDCDDANRRRSPLLPEVCDGLDNNCNDRVDEEVKSVSYHDADGDGFGDRHEAQLSCQPPPGYVQNADDCDDMTPYRNPGLPEICDGLDNNCNGDVDESLLLTFYEDQDNDGYGNQNVQTRACEQPVGYANIAGDCDDTNSESYPDLFELCDAVDNNCNRQTDELYEDLGRACYDGPGQCRVEGRMVCSPGGLETMCDAVARPPQAEVCDLLDNDCDGVPDNGVIRTFYRDNDRDGFGNQNDSLQRCQAPPNYVENNADCDDFRAAVNPNAPEICDGLDNNCNGDIDEGQLLTFYRDNDRDGFGTGNDVRRECQAPAGYVNNSGDCDDNNRNRNPNAQELCDRLDNNCDGAVDPGCECLGGERRQCGTTDIGECQYGTQTCDINGLWGACQGNIEPQGEICDDRDNNCNEQIDDGLEFRLFYRDNDGDGFGNLNDSRQACGPTVGYVANNLDCRDNEITIHPNAPEVCDNIDNNCRNGIDEGVRQTFYRDQDGDGFGTLNEITQACQAPAGYVNNSRDCDDRPGRGNVNPNAQEICDLLDNDCDGAIDENPPTYYPDRDGDGYGDHGNPNNWIAACNRPVDYVDDGPDDCNDRNININPDAREICDNQDNNCNGRIDEDRLSQVAIFVEDSGDDRDDSYRLTVNRLNYGDTPIGESRRWFINLNECRNHTVSLTGVVVPDNVGTYRISFANAQVVGGPPLEGDDLNEGVTHEWEIDN